MAINYYPKTYIKGSAIELELSDTSIVHYLSETKDVINVNNRILKGDFQSIKFTANDQMFYESCIKLIKEVWPEFHAEIMGHIKQMAIIDSDAFGGFTSNLLPDAVFLAHRPYDSLRITENIIHECSHSRLYQLMEIDPVVMNDHEETYHSPWREDPRPMDGVFHGAFVFARIVVWLEKLYNYYPHKQIAERLKVVRLKLSDAVKVIEKHGELSSLGKHVLGEISEVVSETVPQ